MVRCDRLLYGAVMIFLQLRPVTMVTLFKSLSTV